MSILQKQITCQIQCLSAPVNGTIPRNGTMQYGLSARFAWPVGKEGRMFAYRGIIGKREIGDKTGNE